MKKFARLRSICIAILVVFAGVHAVSGAGSELDETRWVFEAHSLVDEWVKADENEPLTLEFRDGRFNGYAGCNAFFGTYSQKGETFLTGPVGSTKMLCYGAQQHQEDVLLEAFEQGVAFKIEGDFLHLDKGDGTSFVYRRAAQLDQ